MGDATVAELIDEPGRPAVVMVHSRRFPMKTSAQIERRIAEQQSLQRTLRLLAGDVRHNPGWLSSDGLESGWRWVLAAARTRAEIEHRLAVVEEIVFGLSDLDAKTIHSETHVCTVCRRSFLVTLYQVRQKTGQVCSVACHKVATQKRRVRYEFNGEQKMLVEWCAQFGVPMKKAWRRLKAGWPFEAAIGAREKA